LWQDARKNILALRFTAASDKDLTQHSGVLGVTNVAEGQDFTAVGVKNASVKVIKDLCLGNTQVPFSDTEVSFGNFLHLSGLYYLKMTNMIFSSCASTDLGHHPATESIRTKNRCQWTFGNL